VGETSRIPFLGHTLATLKDMAKYGYILYINGKRAKLTDFTEADVKKAWAG
jgi:Mn-dependent DtxR family transcriptional regulator